MNEIKVGDIIKVFGSRAANFLTSRAEVIKVEYEIPKCGDPKCGSCEIVNKITFRDLNAIRLSNWCYLEDCRLLESKTNKTTMKNLTEKFIRIFMSKQDKKFHDKGIKNGDDLLTEEGQKIFLNWLFTKNADAFESEVVDKMEDETAK